MKIAEIALGFRPSGSRGHRGSSASQEIIWKSNYSTESGDADVMNNK
jgi:hypothetical protein